MQQDSDHEFTWLQQAYQDEIRPRVLGDEDARAYSPHVAPTAMLVVGIEGAALGNVARTVSDSIAQSGGRPVVIDTVELRRMHDRFSPGLATDMDADVAKWTQQLVADATERRLDPVVAMTTESSRNINTMVGTLHTRGCEVGSLVVRADPSTALRSVRAQALSGEPCDQLTYEHHARSVRDLRSTVDRLDRDPRIFHIRVVDENRRTVHKADASRHAQGIYQAVARVDPATSASPTTPSPFGRRTSTTQGRQR